MDIIGIKVLGEDGLGSFSDVLTGILWAHESHSGPGPAIIVMSLSGPVFVLLNEVINDVVEEGTLVVVASGNNGADACKYSPSSSSGAFTVGSTAPNDQASYFSNYGKCVDMYAPGSSILSAATGTGNGFLMKSGTSMACPHVAGVAAQYFEAFPKATASQISRSMLCNSVPGLINSVQFSMWDDSSHRYLLQTLSSSSELLLDQFDAKACFGDSAPTTESAPEISDSIMDTVLWFLSQEETP